MLRVLLLLQLLLLLLLLRRIFTSSHLTPVLSQRAINMKCTTKKPRIWCRSLYISMQLANNTMLGCIFVTYTDICKHMMFTVQADLHGTSTRFHFHVCLKPLCRRLFNVWKQTFGSRCWLPDIKATLFSLFCNKDILKYTNSANLYSGQLF